MKAICKTCFKALEFRNQRGNKLSDYKCSCGGEFTRAVVHWDNKNNRWFYSALGYEFILNVDETLFLVQERFSPSKA